MAPGTAQIGHHYFTRFGLMLRVALTGPESTGKTTLSRQLAEHYHTVWAPEYARQYQTMAAQLGQDAASVPALLSELSVVGSARYNCRLKNRSLAAFSMRNL